jgi:hypothetical protein
VRPATSCGPSTSPLDARMRELLRLVPVALLAGCVSTASRSPPPEYYFDCDVPPAKFSEWSRTVSTRALRVSGAVELIEPRHDAHWAPLANLFIGGKDDDSRAGLSAYVDWHSPDLLQFILVGPDGPISGPTVLSLRWQGQATQFTLALSESGELKVSAANAVRSMRLTNFDVRSVRLMCSTAQFKFSRVVVEGQQ